MCAGLTVGVERQALAQAAPTRELPGAVEPGRDRPLPEIPAQPNFDFTIEAPQRSQIPRAVEELRFVLRGIDIEGAQTISPNSFASLYQDLIGQQISVSKILDVADAIEDTYRRDGYVLTHAFVPPQRVTNGVFTIKVVEGYVAGLTVQGGSPATQNLVRAYLQPVIDQRPFEFGTLERSLLLLNDLAGVAAAAVLRPSPTIPGASDLVVTVTETPWNGGLSVDNRGSEFQDVWTLGADAAANGVVTVGDQLFASVAASPDFREKRTGQVRYRVPLGTDGLTESVVITATQGKPGASLRHFDLLTNSLAAGPRLSYPVLRTQAASLSIDGGITIQDAQVHAMNGAPPSHDIWRVIDLGASYSNVSLGGSWAGNLDLAQGVNIFSATPNGSPNLSHPGADTEFTKLAGTARHVREIAGPLSLAIAAQAQYGFAPLIAGEQIAFGGTQIGRGYDPGAITGDEGAGGSFELRWDEHYPSLYLNTAEPYVYYDTAKVWTFHPTPGGTLTIASTGLGVRFSLPHAISVDVELSRTLRAVPGSDNGQKVTKGLMDASVRF